MVQFRVPEYGPRCDTRSIDRAKRIHTAFTLASRAPRVRSALPLPKAHILTPTQRNAHSTRTDAPSRYALLFHGRLNDRQRARPTNRVTRARCPAVHRGHASLGTPSDRGRAGVPRDVTRYRRWRTNARRRACARTRCGRVARRAAGRSCCRPVWPVARTRIADCEGAGERSECL